jgi:hypothetical protein
MLKTDSPQILPLAQRADRPGRPTQLTCTRSPTCELRRRRPECPREKLDPSTDRALGGQLDAGLGLQGRPQAVGLGQSRLQSASLRTRRMPRNLGRDIAMFTRTGHLNRIPSFSSPMTSILDLHLWHPWVFCGQFHRMRSGNSRRLSVVGGSVAGQRTCTLWVVGG